MLVIRLKMAAYLLWLLLVSNLLLELFYYSDGSVASCFFHVICHSFSEIPTHSLSREADPRIADIFVTKGPFLKLYTSYIREFEMMCNTLDDARRKYPEFDRVVTDFEVSFV